MPFHLELGSDGHSFNGKAILVNSKTGKHYSSSPIPLAKAKAQKRILEQKEDDPPMDSNPSHRSDGDDSKWIQSVVGSKDFKAGAFTAQAKKEGMTPMSFMKKVLDNPEDYSVTTRRRAQFLKNIQRK